ncbi:MAG: acetyltransferase [Campylobacterota bacterium]|nr:acetyltransferase [Campylobacterota bacterium]
MSDIFIYGASGHGEVVSDVAKACGYKNIIFIDDGKSNFQSFEDVKSQNHIPIAFGIGENRTRKKLFQNAENSFFEIVTLIHPSAVISSTCSIGIGSVIMPNVVVNAHSKIAKGVILNSSCVIEHDNIIENFVHISPNVSLAGNVTIKELSHIGIGSSVIQGLEIGAKCIVGAGSVVVRNIKSGVVAYGNPCKIVKEIHE